MQSIALTSGQGLSISFEDLPEAEKYAASGNRLILKVPLAIVTQFEKRLEAPEQASFDR